MDKTSMFGKSYNTVGSTDTNFIIKTSGDVKILWRNKFIDVVKNGKLASNAASLLQVIEDVEDIYKDGIYLIHKENNDEIWLSIDGNKINLIGEVGTTYVSFLAKQENVTPDLKYLALTNAGFYYETLEDAITAGVKSGLVYIPESRKLYIANNGKFTDYYLELLPDTPSNQFNEIIIGDLRIFTQENNSVLNTSKNNILVIIEGLKYITCGNKAILASKTLEMDLNTKIQSVNANDSHGFRLYNTVGGSVLEVDDIIWRNKEDTETQLVEEFDILGERNVILSAELREGNVIEGDVVKLGSVLCTLKYVHEYVKDQMVYIFLKEKPKILPILSVVDNSMNLDKPVEELLDILVNYENGTSNITIIPAGSTSANFTPIGSIKSIEIVSEFNKILISGNPEVAKSFVLECKVLAIEGLLILLLIDTTYVDNLKNVIICTLNSPQIKILKDTMYILDRTKEVEEDGKKVFDPTVHSQLGVLKEDEIEFLKPPEELPEEYPPLEKIEKPSVGIYSDNFIGINSVLYDTVFKKKLLYPSYDEELQLPENITLEKKYDLVVPNMRWIKDIVKLLIPPGTIVMYNGLEELPEGWVICDGSNGTPDLVGKFIKADTKTGDNDVDINLDKDNMLTLKEEHLPKHTHPHLPHSHTGGTDTGYTYYTDISVSSLGISEGEGSTTYVDSVSYSTSADTHSHSVTLNLSTSREDDSKVWSNTKIKLEPRAYSLIFIMKVYSEKY